MKQIWMFFMLAILTGACGGGSQQENERRVPESASKESNEPTASAETTLSEGKKIYNKFCLVCHQENGAGVQGMYPPLVNTEWVQGDKERLITIIINGQEGPIEVNGEQYNNIMPAHDFLSDEEIADLLTFVRQNFENNASAITAEEVAAVRQSL